MFGRGHLNFKYIGRGVDFPCTHFNGNVDKIDIVDIVDR